MIYTPLKTKTIMVDVFDIYVSVLLSQKQFEAFIEMNDIYDTRMGNLQWEAINGCYAYLLDGNAQAYYILVLRTHDIYTIIHECVHLVHSIVDHLGIPLTIQNTETIAYMTTSLCKKAMVVVEEYTKEHVKKKKKVKV
jgi:hypothetical protein